MFFNRIPRTINKESTQFWKITKNTHGFYLIFLVHNFQLYRFVQLQRDPITDVYPRRLSIYHMLNIVCYREDFTLDCSDSSLCPFAIILIYSKVKRRRRNVTQLTFWKEVHVMT